MIVSVQKQPNADSIALTRQIEQALDSLAKRLPPGISTPQVSFRQADFIDASIANVQEALRDGAIMVAIILLLFLLNVRTTLISLTAIPLSLAITFLVFKALGLSVNVMTLGGLAIAIGELVDDALVDVENVLRRLKEQRPSNALSILKVIAAACNEVRSGVVVATLVVVLVFVPLFALPGIEGRLFAPLGVAYITSILASLAVALTVTPVLCYYLLPRMQQIAHGDSPLVTWLKRGQRRILLAAFAHAHSILIAAVLLLLAAVASVGSLPRAFLPAFNEGTLTIGVLLNPGTSLSESNRIGSLAENLLLQVPEVKSVGRRTGRAELDEHAEGVHVSELDVGLLPAAELKRSMAEVQADIRSRLAHLPAAIAIGQPISHRIDHMLSGVRSQIAIKLFGDDLDTLRGQAEVLRARLAGIPGLADLEVEKQVLAPQITVRVDYAAAAQMGVPAPQVLAALQTLVEGEKVAQVVEGSRRFALVVRLPDSARSIDGLARVLIDTPRGPVPLSRLATIEEGDGPNQISRDDGKRRIVLSANAQGRALSDVVADIRQAVGDTRLPEGYFITLGGQFQAQEEASRLVGLLAIVSLVLMFVVLYTRYRSATLSALIMANIPLALVGAVLGLWVSGQPLSVAALIGFITLAGISVRNGILKVSHYLNLMRVEGERFDTAMIVRGSLERLSPVLMTALVTAFALAPLLLEAERPGTEILHPVAVVIFSGLISSTLLDTFLTPALFWLFGRKDAERLLDDKNAEAF